MPIHMWGFLKTYVQCFSLKLYLIRVCKRAIPRDGELRQLSELFLSILLINDWKSSQGADEITRSGFEDQPGCWFPTINTYFTSCSVEDLPCLATQQISCFRNRNCLQQATSLKGEIKHLQTWSMAPEKKSWAPVSAWGQGKVI